MTSPYADYEPSAPPGHPQPYPSPSPAGTYGGAGHGAYTGPDPFAHPGYPGGHPAMGPAPYPYPYPYPGGYYPVGMLPLPPEVTALPGASPVEAIKRFFRRYTQFRGYASRSEYWWIIGSLILLHIIMFTLLLSVSYRVTASEEPTPAQIVIGVLYICYWLGTLIPTLALSSRRLHDTGNSGLLLIMCFVPGLNYFSWIIILILCSQPSRPERYRPEWS
ncbi:MAG: DUF805 domain-containing protein [Actinomyces bowdenii]|nr:DUF805 domain-containing protein [Actinomyces bowdenii]